MTLRNVVDERTFFFKFFIANHLIDDSALHRSEPQDERAPSAGAKSLCIPFDQSHWAPIEAGKTKCTACGQDAKHWTLFGRSY